MQVGKFYFGARGDVLLEILETGRIDPRSRGDILLSEGHWNPMFEYGSDPERGSAFVARIQISYGPEVERLETPAPRIPDRIALRTRLPVTARLLELHIRKGSDYELEYDRVIGVEAIRAALVAGAGDRASL